jgi:hypothetical protein
MSLSPSQCAFAVDTSTWTSFQTRYDNLLNVALEPSNYPVG